jgi:hypothetical protein
LKQGSDSENIPKNLRNFSGHAGDIDPDRAGFQSPAEPRPGKPVTIPTRYLAHRFLATPTTVDSVTLTLFTDSAGALFIYEDVAQRLKLAVDTLPEKINGPRTQGCRAAGL